MAGRQNLKDIVEKGSPYHVQSWLPLLADYGFRTEMFALGREDAEALTGLSRWSRAPAANKAAAEAQLAGLRARIDEAIARLGGGPVFARLSSRSPKDALNEEKFLRTHDEQLESLRETTPEWRTGDAGVLEGPHGRG